MKSLVQRRLRRSDAVTSSRKRPGILKGLVVAFLFGAGPLVETARADGGLVRLSERVGNYRITVFTAPTPFRAGPVEIGVLVQDADTDRPISDVEVIVGIAPRDGSESEKQLPATSESAGNKLIRAINLDLPSGGWWRFRVAVSGSRGKAEKTFDLEADDPLPRWAEMAPWIALPLVPIGLYVIHLVLVRRREAR